MLQTIGRKAQSKPCDDDISMTLWGHYQVPQWTPPAYFPLRFVRGLLGTALNSTKGDETRSSRTENNGLLRPSFPLAAGASSKGVPRASVPRCVALCGRIERCVAPSQPLVRTCPVVHPTSGTPGTQVGDRYRVPRRVHRSPSAPDELALPVAAAGFRFIFKRTGKSRRVPRVSEPLGRERRRKLLGGGKPRSILGTGTANFGDESSLGPLRRTFTTAVKDAVARHS